MGAGGRRRRFRARVAGFGSGAGVLERGAFFDGGETAGLVAHLGSGVGVDQKVLSGGAWRSGLALDSKGPVWHLGAKGSVGSTRVDGSVVPGSGKTVASIEHVGTAVGSGLRSVKAVEGVRG